MGTALTVRTDHRSLKFILDQRLTTIPQHTWVTKLFGYDLDMVYQPGSRMAPQMPCHVVMKRLSLFLPSQLFHLAFLMLCGQNWPMILVLRSCVLRFLADLHLRVGLRSMVCCSSMARPMFLTPLPCGSSCWLMHMPLDMRAFRKRFIVSACPSTRISTV